MQAKELTYKKAKLVLDECVLRAPEDGTVLRVLTQVGETVGAQARQPAVEFCPNGPRIIRAEVMQEWASKVEPGQVVLIEDDTRFGPQWQGRVKSVAGAFTPIMCRRVGR